MTSDQHSRDWLGIPQDVLASFVRGLVARLGGRIVVDEEFRDLCQRTELKPIVDHDNGDIVLMTEPRTNPYEQFPKVDPSPVFPNQIVEQEEFEE